MDASAILGRETWREELALGGASGGSGGSRRIWCITWLTSLWFRGYRANAYPSGLKRDGRALQPIRDQDVCVVASGHREEAPCSLRPRVRHGLHKSDRGRTVWVSILPKRRNTDVFCCPRRPAPLHCPANKMSPRISEATSPPRLLSLSVPASHRGLQDCLGR